MYQIWPCLDKNLKGIFSLPSSKSHTLRALLFAALARGTSSIMSPLPSPDTEAMIRAISLLGAKVTPSYDSSSFVIEGVDGKIKAPTDLIDCGNSGIVLRFIGALAALFPHYTILTGDDSIKQKRPIVPLLKALRELKTPVAIGIGEDSRPPLVIKGPFSGGKTTLDGSDSQPVSALLIAGTLSPHPLYIHVTNPGETPWIDLTLHWLDFLQIPYKKEGYHHYFLPGNSSFPSFSYTVPGDLSTLAFPLAISLLLAKEKELRIENVDLSDCQGDKILISFFEAMGARFSYDPLHRTLYCVKKGPLQGIEVDLNSCIDALPLLAVVACFCKSPTRLYNGEVARYKESDRIWAMTTELKKMGANIKEQKDGLIIFPSLLQGATLSSHNDHRIALSLTIAALCASSPSLLDNISCIAKTVPHFLKTFLNLGACITEEKASSVCR